MTRFQAHGLLLLAAFLWGAGNVAQKTVLEHIGPLSVVGLRCLIAALALALLLRTEAAGRPDAAWWHSALRVAVLFAGAVTVQQWAYQHTTVTNASFLVNTATVLTPLLAWLWLAERPVGRVLTAAFVTLAGVALMAGSDLPQGRLNAGDMACLIAAVLFAGWMVALGQHAQQHGRPFASAFVQFAVTAAVVLPLAAWIEAPTGAAIVAAGPQLLLLGLFSTAAAYGLQTVAQRFTTASHAAVLVSAESLFGALGAAILLHERLAPEALFGAALIVAAIVIVAVAPVPRRRAQA